MTAVNVALALQRPLLLTGEPGTGKTQLAHSLAWQLARTGSLGVTSARVERFEAKSNSVARDLFYGFDALGRLHAAHAGGSAHATDFVTFSALGRAILDALPRDEVRHLLPPGHVHRGPRRAVVLIDEIDKAPRDFPNDLLNEVDQTFFRIPEVGNEAVGGSDKIPPEFRPIVVITSNSEKGLPDPFLRRCIYYDIPFPDGDRLREVLIARLPGLQGARGPLVDEALAFFLRLRERSAVAHRRISPAELIHWLTWMLHGGAKPDQHLADVRQLALDGLPAMVKDAGDQPRVREELKAFLGAR